MPTFRYRAVDASGKLLAGTMEAPSGAFVASRLKQQGQTAVSADEVHPGGVARLFQTPLRLTRGVSLKDKQLFTREMAVLLKAGVTLEEAANLVIGVTGNVTLRTALEQVANDLREGAGLARALSRQGDIFDGYYFSMIRAGEHSGQLMEAFDGLSRFLEQRVAITESITSALVYPIILAVLVVTTLVLVVTVVLPEFEPIFRDLGPALPMPTRIAMAIGTTFRDYWWLILLAVTAIVAGIVRALRRPTTRAMVDRQLLRLPLVGGLIRKAEAGRFTRSLGALLRGGLPLPQAIALSVDSIRNREIAAKLADTASAVREGGGLTQALQRAAILPDLSLRLIRIGEQSGRLEQMLAEVADLFDADVRRGLDRMMAALVPAITVVMGAIVGGLIASVLLGVMSINQLAVR